VNGGTTANPQINRTGLTAANLVTSFYVGSINSTSSPLPITLISFTAILVNSEVKLNWSTAAEINNAFFTIQKSKDESGWEEVVIVPGSGTTSITQFYSAVDEQPFTGISYYRLKQTDIDGKESISPIVSVKRTEEISNISIYPNPASNQLTVRFQSFGNYQCAIENMNGQTVRNPISVTGNETQMDVSRLKTGIYFIHILHNGQSETKKVMIYR
jgi:hypothetical protein